MRMNKILKDSTVSYKSLGLYFAMQCLIEAGEDISVNRLINMSNDGERLVRTALNELIEKGYVKRETIRVEGKIRGIKYSLIN